MWSFNEFYEQTAKLINPEQAKQKQQRKKTGLQKTGRKNVGHWNGGGIKWWRPVGSRLNRRRSPHFRL